MKFDQESATCHVFVYKEGLLSALGHDLRIAVTSFCIETAEDTGCIKAVFDTGSLHVDCAMIDGAARADVLTARDRKEIDGHIIKSVLETDIYKDIVLISSSVIQEDSSYKVNAALTLRGRTREISFFVREEGGHHVADVLLHLPDFGITPFSTLFGLIKIKPDILIRIVVPLRPDEKRGS
jgi:hypothetical protein